MKKWRLAYADIQSLRLERLFISKGIRIIHKAPHIPAYLLFVWPSKTKAICDIFAQHDVEVAQK